MSASGGHDPEPDDGEDRLCHRALDLALLELLGYSPRPYELRLQLQWPRGRAAAGPDHPDELPAAAAAPSVSRAEFRELGRRYLEATQEEEEVRHAFLVLDSSAAGFVSAADFRAAVAVVAPALTRYTVAAAFRQIDTDGDGRVGYREFEAMMQHPCLADLPI